MHPAADEERIQRQTRIGDIAPECVEPRLQAVEIAIVRRLKRKTFDFHHGHQALGADRDGLRIHMAAKGDELMRFQFAGHECGTLSHGPNLPNRNFASA